MKCKSTTLITAMLLLCFSSVAAAQNPAPTTQAAPPAPATSTALAPPAEPAAKMILEEGTDVQLKFAQVLSSKTTNDDGPINLVLYENLKDCYHTVCNAGAMPVGTITHAT